MLFLFQRSEVPALPGNIAWLETACDKCVVCAECVENSRSMHIIERYMMVIILAQVALMPVWQLLCSIHQDSLDYIIAAPAANHFRNTIVSLCLLNKQGGCSRHDRGGEARIVAARSIHIRFVSCRRQVVSGRYNIRLASFILSRPAARSFGPCPRQFGLVLSRITISDYFDDTYGNNICSCRRV